MSGDNLWDSFLSFHQMGPRDWQQVPSGQTQSWVFENQSQTPRFYDPEQCLISPEPPSPSYKIGALVLIQNSLSW